MEPTHLNSPTSKPVPAARFYPRDLVPYQAFEPTGLEKGTTPATTQKKKPSTKKEKQLCCAKCGHPITKEAARISVSGSHEHGFVNPSGFSFHLGCFSEAPGCGLVGEASDEHTWFPGYAWRIAVCAGCGAHLGWGFHSSGGDRFYGLILGSLTLPQ